MKDKPEVKTIEMPPGITSPASARRRCAQMAAYVRVPLPLVDRWIPISRRRRVEFPVQDVLRVCETVGCEVNIEDRHWRARFCIKCAADRIREQDRARYRKRISYYQARTELKRQARRFRLRICLDCPADISHLHHHAKRCKPCALKRHREQIHQSNLLRNFLFRPGRSDQRARNEPERGLAQSLEM